MKLNSILPLLSAVLLASACCSSRYTAADVNLAAIDQFAFFQPYAFITGYDAHNKAYHDAVDSRTEANMILGIIESERFPFTDVIPVAYEDAQTDDLRWVANFPEVDPKKIDRLRVPKDFRNMLDESGCRYGVVIYARGFIRSKEVLQREETLRAVSRVLDKIIENNTGVYRATNYNTMSAPYGNDMFMAVIDGETDRVVYFVKEISPFYSHPVVRNDVNALVHKLLKDFIR